MYGSSLNFCTKWWRLVRMSLNNESVDHADSPEEPKPRKGLGSGARSSYWNPIRLIKGTKEVAFSMDKFCRSFQNNFIRKMFKNVWHIKYTIVLTMNNCKKTCCWTVFAKVTVLLYFVDAPDTISHFGNPTALGKISHF